MLVLISFLCALAEKRLAQFDLLNLGGVAVTRAQRETNGNTGDSPQELQGDSFAYGLTKDDEQFFLEDDLFTPRQGGDGTSTSVSKRPTATCDGASDDSSAPNGTYENGEDFGDGWSPQLKRPSIQSLVLGDVDTRGFTPRKPKAPESRTPSKASRPMTARTASRLRNKLQAALEYSVGNDSAEL